MRKMHNLYTFFSNFHTDINVNILRLHTFKKIKLIFQSKNMKTHKKLSKKNISETYKIKNIYFFNGAIFLLPVYDYYICR